MPETPLPQGVELTSLDEQFRRDPYPVLHGVPVPGKLSSGCWGKLMLMNLT